MKSQFLQSPRLTRFGRRGGVSLADYAANGKTPALVADFENDVYLGTIESFADFTTTGSPSFDTVVGARRLVVDVAADTVKVPAAKMPAGSAFSFALEGEITYSDTDAEDIRPLWWDSSSTNYVTWRLTTTASQTGYLITTQRESVSGIDSSNGGIAALQPGTNVPFSIASRHGATFIQGAFAGTSYPENATPTALFDGSATDLRIATTNTGSATFRIKKLVVWAEDIGAAGIREASSRAPYGVVAVLGQSNALGNAVYDGNGLHPAGVYQWTPNDQLEMPTTTLAHPGEINGDMGLEISFAERWRAANPGRHLMFVPAAMGATGFFSNDWNVGDTYYDAAVAQINAALANTHDATLEAILWVQGERDAKDDTGYVDAEAEYATALDAMITGLRSEVTGAASVPFIAGQIGDFGNAIYPNVAGVNAAIADLPNRKANTAYVSSAGFVDDGDDLHFDAQSLRDLGVRMYAALTGTTIATLSDYTLNGARPAMVADFESDVYFGTVSAFSDFIESGTAFDTVGGARRLVVDNAVASLSLPLAKIPAPSPGMSIVTAGHMSYTDNDLSYSASGGGGEIVFALWKTDHTSYIETLLRSNLGDGRPYAHIEQAPDPHIDVYTDDTYTPGTDQPFAVAGRFAASAVNVAADGVAGTARTTGTVMYAADGAAMQFNPQTPTNDASTVKYARIVLFDQDIGDAGIVEATA